MFVRTLIHRMLMQMRPAFVASFLKRVFHVERAVVETEHGRFFVDPASQIGRAILDSGYEPEMIRTLRRLLREGDTFLDVGANEGYFAVIAGKLVGDKGRVLAVEPQSRLQSVIWRNIRENRLNNVRVLHGAIGKLEGALKIFLSPDMNTGSSGIVMHTRYRIPAEDVRQTTLGGLLNAEAINSVRLMKMDIEGAEHDAIMGSRQVFEAGIIENIALELHPQQLVRLGHKSEDVVEFLRGCGYRQDQSFSSFTLRRGPF